MATNPNVEGRPNRRMILRRSRGGGGGGFGSGISTRSESLRTGDDDAIDDEVDDAIDPDQLSRRVRSGDLTVPPPGGRENPRARLNQVSLAGSASYAKEYRLTLLHRLLMRGVPLDQIATQLQVSISTVEKDRAELKKRLREAATQLNIDEMVGGQNGFYDEITAMALRVASGNGEGAAPTPMKLAAMRTALAANADRTRFLNTAGVFDVLRFRKTDSGEAVSDIQRLMLRTSELLDEVLNPGDPSEDDAPPPRRAGGFDPMTFDDVGASGSGNEVQEL